MIRDKLTPRIIDNLSKIDVETSEFARPEVIEILREYYAGLG